MKKRHEALLEELRKIAPTEPLLKELYQYAQSQALMCYFYSVKPHIVFEKWENWGKEETDD